MSSYLKRSPLADRMDDQSTHKHVKVTGGQVQPLDTASSPWRTTENPSRHDSGMGRCEVTRGRHVPLLSPGGTQDCSPPTEQMPWGESSCTSLFFNLFWHAKYFHFCSGSRSTEDGAECSAHCGGAAEGPAFCQPDGRAGSRGRWGLTQLPTWPKTFSIIPRLLCFADKAVSPPEYFPWTEQTDKFLCYRGNIPTFKKKKGIPPTFGERKGHTGGVSREGQWGTGEHCTLLHLTSFRHFADTRVSSHVVPPLSVKEIGTSRGQFKSQVDRSALWHWAVQ